MADDDQQASNISVSVPIGVLASVAVLGAAAAAYVFLNRGDTGIPSPTGIAGKGKSVRRKIGLTTVITVLENDASRKVVLSILRAMARRA
jgi:hypothetical protein